jgi:hypothetical protein
MPNDRYRNIDANDDLSSKGKDRGIPQTPS